MAVVVVVSNAFATHDQRRLELEPPCASCMGKLFQRMHFLVDDSSLKHCKHKDTSTCNEHVCVSWRRIELHVTLSDGESPPITHDVLLYHSFPGAPLGVLIRGGAVLACLGEHDQCCTSDVSTFPLIKAVKTWYKHKTHRSCVYATLYEMPLDKRERRDGQTDTASDNESGAESEVSSASSVRCD
jgi:hypothetical protein